MDGHLIHVNCKRKRNEEEDSEEMDVIVFTLSVIIAGLSWLYIDDFIPREPSYDWDHERRCYLNRLFRGSEKECIDQLRVSKQGFANLCKVLREKGKLTRTKNVSIEEAVAMFLHILAHNLKYRVIHLNFYRSKETISRQFNSVLSAVLRITKDYLKLHEHVLNESDAGRWKWFENCLGALDGSHIQVTVSAEVRPRYRNRKGDISTNMLGACSPDLIFIYVLPGWEGFASDSRVLRDAICRHHRLHVPNGIFFLMNISNSPELFIINLMTKNFYYDVNKYYLVDAGYTNGPGFLAPYRGTRYHLNEWTGNTPTNYKELFNLRHTVARNAIERSFGVLKKRWSILRTRSFFDIDTQIRIINACCVLHNFIQIEQYHDPILAAQDSRIIAKVDRALYSQQATQENVTTGDEITCVKVTEQWTAFRDMLANKMFDDYRARRG